MKKRLSLLLLGLFFTAGCTNQVSTGIAIPEQHYPIKDLEKIINKISVGMNKHQVIELLGYPLTTEADGVKECLTYPLTTALKSNFSLLFENGILTKYNKSQNCVSLFRNSEY